MEEFLSQELQKTASQSGFPFQIGVRKEIERTASEHGWNVVAEEHHWFHTGLGKSGFIDLIVEHNHYFFTLIIEYKRVRAKDRSATQGPSWIFLTTRGYTSTQHRLSAFIATKGTEHSQQDPARKAQPTLWGWANAIDFNPPTLESAYCLFEKQDEQNPTIERIADALLPSTEAVGMEE